MGVRLFAPQFELPTAPTSPPPSEWDDELLRRCVACNTEFRAIRRNGRYCTRQCYRKHFYAKRREAADAGK